MQGGAGVQILTYDNIHGEGEAAWERQKYIKEEKKC